MADRVPSPTTPTEPRSLPERIFVPTAAGVEVGLLGGEKLTGQVTRFSPATPDLTLGSATPGAPKRSVPAERIAYIGFLKPPGAPPPLPQRRVGALKVHVSGGRTFLVDAEESEGSGAIGFYAKPSEPQSPYKEIFFYQHGVNAKELNEPLGALLVREGRVGAAGLEQGLQAQKEESRTPIGQILVEHRKIDQAQLEQAAALQKRKGTRIGEVLIEAGLANAQDIELALAEQRRRGGKRIGQILVDLGMVSEADLSMTLAKKFQLPYVDLDSCEINLSALSELPRDVIEKHKVLPVDTSQRALTVAMGDPLAVDVIDLLRIHSKKQVIEVVARPSLLEKYIPTYLDRLETKKVASEMDTILKNLSLDDPNAGIDQEQAESALVRESDNAIIKLANQIIIDAYRRGASDIHIEPNGKERTTLVRFRVEGECASYQEIPSAYRMPLVARLKIMAQLDITERRKPQDGKIRFKLGDKHIELRVATIPTVNNNEDIVLRILAASKPVPLEKLGLSERNLSELSKLVRKPYGLVLCVGPTGSGKTTTLHSCLGSINTVDTKIWTAEDPVEITQPGLRQVQVQSKIGFTFAAAMRAFLRADPDVIMVGEMRDAETAGTAIEASLTGHLVLSTLHTNSAPETITRLIDMGMDPFSFADALLGVLAQRLARGLCLQCRESYVPGGPETEELGALYGDEAFDKVLEKHYPYGLKLWRGKGCAACGNSGYKGRIALHELLVTDDALKRAVQRKGTVDELRELAAAGGMTTLLQDGIEKVLAGQTDLKQVLAVCSR